MRYRVLVVLVGLAVSLGVMSRPSSAYTLEEYTSGLWTVYAWADSSTGRFDYCGMETTFTDGSSLIVAVFGDGIEVWATDPAWRLPPGYRTSATVRIDNRYNSVKPALESGHDRLEILFGWDTAFWRAFRLGNNLNLSMPGLTPFPTSLRGTNHASDALLVCWDVYGSGYNPLR
mgnify:CR=1 FL=1